MTNKTTKKGWALLPADRTFLLKLLEAHAAGILARRVGVAADTLLSAALGGSCYRTTHEAVARLRVLYRSKRAA